MSAHDASVVLTPTRESDGMTSTMTMTAATVPRALVGRARRRCARRFAASARPTATVADADDAYNAAMKAYSETPYEYKHELGLCACRDAFESRDGGVFERERRCPRHLVPTATAQRKRDRERRTTNAMTDARDARRRLSPNSTESHRRHATDDARGRRSITRRRGRDVRLQHATRQGYGVLEG